MSATFAMLAKVQKQVEARVADLSKSDAYRVLQAVTDRVESGAVGHPDVPEPKPE